MANINKYQIIHVNNVVNNVLDVLMIKHVLNVMKDIIYMKISV